MLPNGHISRFQHSGASMCFSGFTGRHADLATAWRTQHCSSVEGYSVVVLGLLLSYTGSVAFEVVWVAKHSVRTPDAFSSSSGGH